MQQKAAPETDRGGLFTECAGRRIFDFHELSIAFVRGPDSRYISPILSVAAAEALDRSSFRQRSFLYFRLQTVSRTSAVSSDSHLQLCGSLAPHTAYSSASTDGTAACCPEVRAVCRCFLLSGKHYRRRHSASCARWTFVLYAYDDFVHGGCLSRKNTASEKLSALCAVYFLFPADCAGPDPEICGAVRTALYMTPVPAAADHRRMQTDCMGTFPQIYDC